MTYTTTATRAQLKELIPKDMVAGAIFLVSITPVSDEEADVIAFRRLKGIVTEDINLDQIKGERLLETIN